MLTTFRDRFACPLAIRFSAKNYEVKGHLHNENPDGSRKSLGFSTGISVKSLGWRFHSSPGRGTIHDSEADPLGWVGIEQSLEFAESY